MLLVAVVVLAFLWRATEWTAWQLGFQAQLGPPWFEFLGWPCYRPPAFFWWWFTYDAYAHDIFVNGAFVAASGGVAAIAVAVAMSVWRARASRPTALTVGPRRGRFGAPASFNPMACSSGAGAANIYAMTGRNMSVLRANP